MAEPHPLPIVVKPFPEVVLAPEQPFTEINLAEYIENPPLAEQALHFLVRFDKGELPVGFSLSPEGIFSIAPTDSQRRVEPYQFIVYADNGGKELFTADLVVWLQTSEEPASENPPAAKEALSESPIAKVSPAPEQVAAAPVTSEGFAEEDSSIEYLNGKAYQKIKSEIWQKIFKGETPEEITQLFSGNPTFAEIYYMIGRFADFVIWNADDHVSPGELKELAFEGLTEHFKVIDRGACLVSLPCDLYSHERTLSDSLEVARIMAREVFKRGWRVEFGGYDKMVSAAWVELQLCMKREKNSISIVFYEPSQYDYFLLDQAMKKEPVGEVAK